MSSKPVYVLGINAYDHDVSACLLRDGVIAYAIEKERVTRNKHATGFYREVVDYCLQAEGIKLADVDLIVRNCYVLPVEDMETRLMYESIPEFMDDEERLFAHKHELYLSTSPKVMTISHHMAHAYSAFAVCPYEVGAVMIVDGVGSYAADIKEPGQLTEGVNPLARESESYYSFKGAQLTPVKKVWLDPVRGFLSDEFFFMRGLGAAYSKVSSYIFADWNKSKLDSYLIEITAEILAYSDEDGQPMVDKILDTAGQKGTGKWTASAALDQGIPLTLIGEAVFSRFLSALKDERSIAAELLGAPAPASTVWTPIWSAANSNKDTSPPTLALEKPVRIGKLSVRFGGQ